MEGIALLWVATILISVCIAFAPLVIWRNTNRMNKMLGLVALRVGASPEEVRAVMLGGDPALKPDKRNKVCPSCKALRPVSESSCRFCGHAFVMAPQTTLCPDCGEDITHMPGECPRCGKAFIYKSGC